MSAARSLNISVETRGVRETLFAFRRLPKDASDSLRDRSMRLSKVLATRVQAAAIAEGGQAKIVAPTVKARRDRVPAITAGGNERVGKRRVPAHKLVFGSEFGAKRRFGWYSAYRYRNSTGRQYKRHLGQHSYWFFRTVDENTAAVNTAWHKIADDIVNSFVREP